MMYRAKVTEIYPAIKSLLVDFYPSYVFDRRDVYAEVSSDVLADTLERVNSMSPVDVVTTFRLCTIMRDRCYDLLTHNVKHVSV